MAPKKSQTKASTSAGAGKNFPKATPARTRQREATASSPDMDVFTVRRPQSNLPKSGPMQTHLLPRASTADPSIAITKKSLRKRIPSDTTSSSPAALGTADSEVDTSAASKVATKTAAFHEARGLSFEELYVHPDHPTNAVDLPTIKATPQKNSNRTMKAPAKKSAAVKSATSPKPVSHKRTRANDDKVNAESSPVKRGTSTETDTKPVPNKRVAESDIELTPSPIKRLKINPPRLPGKRPAESSDDEPVPMPAKRLKINPPRPAASTPVAATPVAATPVAAIPAAAASRNAKPASKTKGGPVITKNGNIKKTPVSAVERAFEGTPKNHGSSIERPDHASLDTPWSCANLSCSTGMTWVPRDTKDPITGKGPMGRKVISQFFGRNKSPTKLIPNDVWHFYCRKDYQRARYAAEHGTADELAKQVIGNLRDQLIRLKLWRPDALFQVQLDKGATDRLNNYFALLRQHGNNEAAALAALPGPKDPSKVKPEEAFPPALAEAFNQRFKTAGKEATANYDDLEAVIAWSEAEIDAGRSTVFVPAEFLINPIQAGETVNNVNNNFADWEVVRAARIAQAIAQANNAARANNAAQANNTSSSSAPTTSNALPQAFDVVQSIEDPDATESEPEAPTPTPAPRHARIQSNPNDPMSMLRQLNDVAAAQGYHARSDRSSS